MTMGAQSRQARKPKPRDLTPPPHRSHDTDPTHRPTAGHAPPRAPPCFSVPSSPLTQPEQTKSAIRGARPPLSLLQPAPPARAARALSWGRRHPSDPLSPPSPSSPSVGFTASSAPASGVKSRQGLIQDMTTGHPAAGQRAARQAAMGARGGVTARHAPFPHPMHQQKHHHHHRY